MHEYRLDGKYSIDNLPKTAKVNKYDIYANSCVYKSFISLLWGWSLISELFVNAERMGY